MKKKIISQLAPLFAFVLTLHCDFIIAQTTGFRSSVGVSKKQEAVPSENNSGCNDSAFNQEWTAITAGGGGLISDRSTGFSTADNFSVTVPLDLTSVCFWGIYGDLGIITSPCAVLPDATDDTFEITYYLDNGGVPGVIHAGPFAVSSTRKGTGFNTFLSEIFQYEVTHPPVPVQPGLEYWVEISNDITAPCAWLWTDLSNTPNDGIAFQFGSGPAIGDFPFNLGGAPTVIPTIGEWGLIATGLLLLIVGTLSFRKTRLAI